MSSAAVGTVCAIDSIDPPVDTVGIVILVAVGSIGAKEAVAVCPGFGGRADARVSIGQGRLQQAFGDVHATRQGSTSGAAWQRRGGHALKRVVFLGNVGRGLVEGSARLVVGEVRLPRVGEEGYDGGDAACGPSLAGGYHDAELDEVVVELTAVASETGLDDVDIFPADRVLDFTATPGERASATSVPRLCSCWLDICGIGSRKSKAEECHPNREYA